MRRSSMPLLFLLLACHTEASKPATDNAKPPVEPEPVEYVEPKSDSLPPRDGFFMAAGAPDPRACKVAEDCRGDTIPDVDNPCCQNPRTLEPHARAYATWVVEWRREHCTNVTCPPPPPPARPRDCAFELDCVDGVCTNSCP